MREHQTRRSRKPAAAAGLTLQIIGSKLERVKVQLMDPEPGGGSVAVVTPELQQIFVKTFRKAADGGGLSGPTDDLRGEERSQSHV